MVAPLAPLVPVVAAGNAVLRAARNPAVQRGVVAVGGAVAGTILDYSVYGAYRDDLRARRAAVALHRIVSPAQAARDPRNLFDVDDKISVWDRARLFGVAAVHQARRFFSWLGRGFLSLRERWLTWRLRRAENKALHADVRLHLAIEQNLETRKSGDLVVKHSSKVATLRAKLASVQIRRAYEPVMEGQEYLDEMTDRMAQRAQEFDPDPEPVVVDPTVVTSPHSRRELKKQAYRAGEASYQASSDGVTATDEVILAAYEAFLVANNQPGDTTLMSQFVHGWKSARGTAEVVAH